MLAFLPSPAHTDPTTLSRCAFLLVPIRPQTLLQEASEWPPPTNYVRPLTPNSFVIYLVGSAVPFSCWPGKIVPVPSPQHGTMLRLSISESNGSTLRYQRQTLTQAFQCIWFIEGESLEALVGE